MNDSGASLHRDNHGWVLGAQPRIVFGVTSAQTCIVLVGRLKAFREAGFRVTVLSSPGELLDRISREEEVDVVSIPMERGISVFKDIRAWFRIWCALRNLSPDMVEFSTPKAGLLGLTAALLAGVRHRVYLLRGLRLERTVGLKRAVLLAAERCAAACAQLVVCNSYSLRTEVEDLGIAPSWKLKVIGAGSSRGVNVEQFRPGQSDFREHYGIPSDVTILGFVGRLTCDKGLPELLVAFDAILQKHSEALLLLVGWYDAAEDALSSVIRERIESHPRIICTGYVPDTAPYYRAMDIFILPTWREGFPNAALEAAASGVPAITTLSTGARDAVVPEVTGLLVPPGYPEAISEAVNRLLSNPSERQRMGRAARVWVLEHFVDHHILQLTIDFYKGIIVGRKPLFPANRHRAIAESESL